MGNLEVSESPELEIEIRFHEELDDGKNCNVYFDGEQGSESADAEHDPQESHIADHLNEENKPLESENGPSFEDNKRSREIEELQDGDASKDMDVVDQPTGDVIEELDFDDIEDYDVENVMTKQEI